MGYDKQSGKSRPHSYEIKVKYFVIQEEINYNTKINVSLFVTGVYILHKINIFPPPHQSQN